MASIPVALQLYTVRELLAEDYPGTLRRAKEIGYDVVQLTGKIPYEAEEMKELLDEIGLGVAGIHVGLNELESNLDHWAEFGRTVGTRDLVCPYMPDDRRGGREDWVTMAGVLGEIGARCREQGCRLSYHNHSFEFVEFNGTYALDLLYENSDPQNLYAELDTYWIKHGGADPVAYIRRYSGRVPLLHVKDMADDEGRSFAEVGNGILDWDAIHEASVEAGVECYCVEQDVCPGDPLESARTSRDFLAELQGE